MINIILWIILGGAAGWLASVVMKQDARMGMIENVIVGIVGASIGGFLFNMAGFATGTGFNIWTLFVAFIGSVVLLAIINFIRRMT